MVGLDVGSNLTCAVIAETRTAGEAREQPLNILGVGVAFTEGLTGSTVTNLEATTDSIRAAIQEAELMAGREVESAFIGLAGMHVTLSRSKGVVAVTGVEVESGDLRRVDEVGRAIPIAPDSELIHALCTEYVVDGRPGIQDPVGMTATRLESEVCIVTASSAACRDLRKAVDRAGYRPEQLVLEPLASSLSVLGEGEREAGVALIELGGVNTDLVAFEGRKIRLLHCIPWGARAVTRDIARGLGVPEEEAACLQRDYGVAVRSRVDPAEQLEVSGPALDSDRKVSRELLAHIIEQRLDEILGLAYEQLDDSGLLDRLRAGIVLTGSGAALPGTVELARSVFNLPVRLGEPGARLAGMVDVVRKPALSTGVGLALYGSMRTRTGGFAGVARWFARCGEWLKDFF